MLQALGNAVSVQTSSFSASLTHILWDFKWSFKDLGLSSHPQRGKKGSLQWVEVQPCACRVLWTPALHWHLLSGSSTWESCRWGKCGIKAEWLIYLRPGLQCPSPRGWAAPGAPVLLQLCHWLSAQQAKGWGALLLPTQKIYFKAQSIRQHQLEFLRQIHL